MMRIYALLAGALLLLMAALGLRAQLLPLPEVPEHAVAGEFDTRRALARLRRVLTPERPHPVDSAEGDAVRERLLAELRALGLQPQVTDDFACNSNPRFPGVSCARVRNIVATIGPARGRHIIATAHYDSSAAGPGAADDGIGIATLLEVAEQLRLERLARPVTFLITDGEEAGLIGARAFIERHPIARDVAALVNFEARGVTGPALMFETSHPNRAAIAVFAADRPAANSMASDFYRLIPNSTDVAVFAERGWILLNFAVIGNETRYHSAGDTLAALDARSLGHMGQQGLTTLRGLATRPLPGAQGEVHYTDLLGRRLIVIPALLSFVLLGLLLLFWTRTAWRRRRGLGLATVTVIAGLVDAAVIGWVGQFLVALFREGHWWRAHPEATAVAIGLSALAACAGPLFLVRERPTETLRAAFWLLFLVLGAVAALVAPGGTILFLLPPFIAAVGAGTRWEGAAAAVAATAMFLLFAPLLALVEILLGAGSAWMFAPLAAAILWPWLIELRVLFAATRPVPVLATVFAALTAGWIWVAAAPASSDDRQQRFGVEYAWDADARQGRWAVVNDGAPLPAAYGEAVRWERGAEVAWGAAPRWTASAPAMAVDPPSIEILTERAVAGGRIISLRIGNSGLDSVVLRGSPQARLVAVSAGGFTREVGPSGGEDDPYILRCVGRSCDGATFELRLMGQAPAEWILIGARSGLPEAARPLLAARPPHARPQYTPDSTIVTRRLHL